TRRLIGGPRIMRFFKKALILVVVRFDVARASCAWAHGRGTAVPPSICTTTLILFSLLLLLNSTASLKAQTPPAPEVIVIRAGRLFDSEKGIFLPARTIIVKGNLIEAVGENLPVPSGARVIDLSRYTV